MKRIVQGKRVYSLLLLLLMQGVITYAQDAKEESSLTLGLGLGLDYGGIGLKASAVKFSPQFELTLGIGYNLNFIGLNGGLLARTPPGNPQYTYQPCMVMLA